MKRNLNLRPVLTAVSFLILLAAPIPAQNKTGSTQPSATTSAVQGGKTPPSVPAQFTWLSKDDKGWTVFKPDARVYLPWDGEEATLAKATKLDIRQTGDGDIELALPEVDGAAAVLLTPTPQ